MMLLSVYLDKSTVRAVALKREKARLCVRAVCEAPLPPGDASAWGAEELAPVAGLLRPVLCGGKLRRAVLMLSPDWCVSLERVYKKMPRLPSFAACGNDLRMICHAQDDSEYVFNCQTVRSPGSGGLFPDQWVSGMAVPRGVMAACRLLLGLLGVRKIHMQNYDICLFAALQGSGEKGAAALAVSIHEGTVGLFYTDAQKSIGRNMRWAYCGAPYDPAARAEALIRRFLPYAAGEEAPPPAAFFIGPERLCGEIMDTLSGTWERLRADFAFPAQVAAASGLPEAYSLPVWAGLAAVRGRKGLGLWLL